MKKIFILGTWCVCANWGVRAEAVGTIPITGFDAPMHYDLATGEMSEQGRDRTRSIGRPLWAMVDVNGFACFPDDWVLLDCGDMERNTAVKTIGFTYATNCQEGEGTIEIWMPFYVNENNFDSQERELIGLAVLTDLPGSTHPVIDFWGRSWTATLNEELVFDGADLDGDELQDFGYGYLVADKPGAGLVGFCGAGEPNRHYPLGPGAEDGWDFFERGDDGLGEYIGYYDFTDPNMFGQYYLALYAAGCPNRGASGGYCEADIYGSDCVVGLGDLAVLLGNYGMTGAGPLDGDIYPYSHYFYTTLGDGKVDMHDLAEMLGQYGDDCNGE